MKAILIILIVGIAWFAVKRFFSGIADHKPKSIDANKNPARVIDVIQDANTEAAPPVLELPELEQLLTTDKAKGLEALTNTLANGNVGTDVLDLARVNFEGSGDHALLDALIARLPRAHNFTEKNYFVQTIRMVDKDKSKEEELAALASTQRDLHFSRDLIWAIKELTGKTAAEDFVTTGLLTAPTPEAVAEVCDDYGFEEELDDDGMPLISPMILIGLIKESPAVESFEAYKPSKYTSYEELLAFAFGNLTPPLTVSNVVVEFDEERFQTTNVAWEMNGQTIRESHAPAAPLEVEWFAEMINRHFATLNTDKRCLLLDFSDDSSTLCIADPNALKPLVEKYHLGLVSG